MLVSLISWVYYFGYYLATIMLCLVNNSNVSNIFYLKNADEDYMAL